MFNHPFKLDHVLSMHFNVVQRRVLGVTPDGIRSCSQIEGAVTGERVRGRILPVSADWARMRSDGVLVPDVTIMIETEDGATIQVNYMGIVDMGENRFADAVAGKPLSGVRRVATGPRMLTAHPKYLWLNRLQFLGIGAVDFETTPYVISYDIYAVDLS